MQTTDYILPSHDWTPSCGIALTRRTASTFPARADGLLSQCAGLGHVGHWQIAFYGMANYLADAATYQANVQINTPITRIATEYFLRLSSQRSTGLGLQAASRASTQAAAARGFPRPPLPAPTQTSSGGDELRAGLEQRHKTLYIAVSQGRGPAGISCLSTAARSRPLRESG